MTRPSDTIEAPRPASGSTLSGKAKRVAAILGTRPKGWRSLLYNTAMAKARIPGPLMAPVHLSIEPTNVCNLRCPVCETGNGSMARGRGMLDKAAFEKLIDEAAPHTSVLMFYFMGEPFLNKHAYDMIRYAREAGIYVETCTNGDYVDAKGVIYSDLNEINFQIGGIDQESHEVYRVRSNLERVTKNLTDLIEERRKSPGSALQINVGFIVMRHNEHQVPEFLRWAKEIGADLANVIDPCVRNVIEGHQMLPKDKRYWFYDEEAFERGVLKPKHLHNNECTWIWNSVMVNWDGSLVPCCRDAQGKHVLGNVFERSLRDTWNGDKARAFRKRVVSAQGEVDICQLCSGYGVPRLEPKRPIDFAVSRLSLDSTPVDFAFDAEGTVDETPAPREHD